MFTSIINTKYATLAANGQTAVEVLPQGEYEAEVYVQASPTWGAGTLKLQGSPDGGTTWIDFPATSSWTTGGNKLTNTTPIRIPAGIDRLRFDLAGATGPSITPQLVVRKADSNVVLGAQPSREPVKFTFTADGTGASFYLNDAPEMVGLVGWGTWGAGTITLQTSPDAGTTWYALDTLTANGIKRVTGLRDNLFRLVLSGSTSPALTVVVG